MPDARAVPLKAGQWNKCKLALANNEVTVSINDVEIARRTLEPTNSRTFGLFRYADAHAVRVRHVVYRGNWPQSLPSLVDQELAGSSTAPPAGPKSKTKASPKAKPKAVIP